MQRIRQGWFTENEVHQGDEPPPSAPDVPCIAEHNSDLLPTTAAIEKYYLTASKSKIKTTRRADLMLLIKIKRIPRGQGLTENQVKTLRNADLHDLIHEQVCQDYLFPLMSSGFSTVGRDVWTGLLTNTGA